MAETVQRPNLVGCEVLGRGLAFTVNYERSFTNHFGAGGGIMAIGASGGGITLIPLYASYAPGHVHSVYLSAGATFVGGGGSIEDYYSTWLINGSVGYQFKSPSGFFVRPLFTILVPSVKHSGDDYLLWPGVTIGGTF